MKSAGMFWMPYWKAHWKSNEIAFEIMQKSNEIYIERTP